MNVLVIGSGGREHALCSSIAKSPKCSALFCAPGNGGISDHAYCVDISVEDIDGIVSFAIKEKIKLVVIGPEVPLVLGLSDRLVALGIDVFGPSAAAAQIEGSKGMMKDICAKYNIPTAKYKKFKDPKAAKQFVHIQGAPIVVKADGLAAGKGVIICSNEFEAYAAIDYIMVEKAFGAAGSEVVIEEFLEGEEASFFALVCEEEAIPLATAQDYKAAFDGDDGPNTGGMGAYSPTSIIDNVMMNRIMGEIINPTIRGMVTEDIPFRGVLFAGLMITDEGPKLIEYNCRFGDPECQTLMTRLKSDALDLLLATAQCRLHELKLEWHKEVALTVILASQGYPSSYNKGSEILGCDAAGAMEGVFIFHSGTILSHGKIIANGGRVLGVTAKAPDVASAQKRAYEAVDRIDWPEGFCRRDIGWREIERNRKL